MFNSKIDTESASVLLNRNITDTQAFHIKGDFGRRIPFIDGMRAVSITLVLISHIPYASEITHIEGWIYGHGDLGVRVFFVLSGFLITGLLMTEIVNRSTIDITTFLKKRAFRLMPVYWSYLLVVAVATIAGIYDDKLSSWVGAVTYTRNVIGVGNSVTVHFWSLAIEEQFYFLWPFCLAALSIKNGGFC